MAFAGNSTDNVLEGGLRPRPLIVVYDRLTMDDRPSTMYLYQHYISTQTIYRNPWSMIGGRPSQPYIDYLPRSMVYGRPSAIGGRPSAVGGPPSAVNATNFANPADAVSAMAPPGFR